MCISKHFTLRVVTVFELFYGITRKTARKFVNLNLKLPENMEKTEGSVKIATANCYTPGACSFRETRSLGDLNGVLFSSNSLAC